jgi:GMP synthase (glutamine-hydrolysing)
MIAPRLLVIQPDPRGGPDYMAKWASEQGVEIDIVTPFTSVLRPESVREYDGLVVLGGEMGDLDTAQYPWLEDIREAFRIAEQDGVPSLGICLGAQLLASSLGGRVAQGEAGLETGVVEIVQLPAASADPLLQGLPETFSVGAMHYDAVVELPPGATLLATGSRYPHQAFRQGSCWGVQFHPEVSPANYESWVDAAVRESPESEQELERTVEEFSAAFSVIAPSTGRLFSNFFELVRTRN